MDENQLLYLSLFSGACGGDLACQHLLGWRCVGYVEKDDWCQRIVRQRIDDGFLDEAPIHGDIRQGDCQEWLTSLPGASLARTLVPQIQKGKESAVNDHLYGENTIMPFAYYDHESHLWKTRQQLLIGGSENYSETWPKSGIMLDGIAFRHRMLEHRISEIDSGLWPTPLASDGGLRARLSIDSLTKIALRDGPSSIDEALAAEFGRVLHPAFSEWMMNQPIGWTDLKPLETDRFQSWLRLHGIYSQEDSLD